MTKQILWIGICCLFVAVITACGMVTVKSWPAMEGRVVDYETKAPIADAHVIATWGGHVAYDTSRCVHLAATKTDADGYYRFPRQQMDNPYVRRSNMKVAIIAHKYGYKWPRALGDVEYLQKDNATGEERIRTLMHVSSLSDCGNTRGRPQPSVVPLLRDLHTEAVDVARTKKEKFLEGRLWHYLMRREFGSDKADDIYYNRQQKK